MKRSILKRHAVILAIGVLSVGASALQSLAAPIVYFDRDDNAVYGLPRPKSDAQFNKFTSALSSYGVETVEGIDTTNPLVAFDPTLTFGATGITATTQQSTIAIATPFPNYFAIGGKMLVENDALAGFDPMAPQFPATDTIFNLNKLVTAFGLYVFQGGDEGAPPDPNNNNNPTIFRLKNTIAGTSVFVPVQIGPGWGFHNAFFLGLTDTQPFNQVSIIESLDVPDGMTYDNLVAGFAIPEPNSFALVILSGASVLFGRARVRCG